MRSHLEAMLAALPLLTDAIAAEAGKLHASCRVPEGHGMAKKSAAKKPGTRKGTQKRQRIDTGTDTRYVKRTSTGRFKESDDAGRAQKADRPKRARKKVSAGYGDQGDRKKKR